MDDLYVINDSGPQRYAVSLGLFPTEDAARSHLADISKQGSGNAVTDSSGLAIGTAASHVHPDVILADALGNGEGLKGENPLRLCEEVVLQFAAIDGELTGSGREPHGRQRPLATL